MTFSDHRSHSEPLLKSLRLLKFSDMSHLEILSFVYQWYHKLSPSCFVNYFNPVSSIHSYNTRQSQIDNLFVKSRGIARIFSEVRMHDSPNHFALWFLEKNEKKNKTTSVYRLMHRVNRPNWKLPIWSSLYRFWIRNLKWVRCLVNSQCCSVNNLSSLSGYFSTFDHTSKTKMELTLSWI